MSGLWPRSLKGQLLLAVAIALLLAQSINALLLYRAQAERREANLIHSAAFRLAVTNRPELLKVEGQRRFGGRQTRIVAMVQQSRDLPRGARGTRYGSAETELRRVLEEQSIAVGQVVIVRRALTANIDVLSEPDRRRWQAEHRRGSVPTEMMVASVYLPESKMWNTVRVIVPPGERTNLMTLFGQTLLIGAILFGAIAFILRRITRPLADLTGRIRHFGETREFAAPLLAEGPDDVRRLIDAHNGMEQRILALLDEKDVMLGAIGHDLKTPLAALRVRIESVEDDTERAKMATTIEDITRTLDDILSLARVGRPTDPLEQSELSALVASVAEEYEDLGKPVTLGETVRLAMPLRATWLRRALRNLTDNALRYGKVARVSLRQDWRSAIIVIEDDGPGMPEQDLARMQEPFTRGDPSRNSSTGGAGLGLALARAIAEQHGGSLRLRNRQGPGGAVEGLTAELVLPLTVAETTR